MRRTAIGLAVVLLVGLLGGSASAGVHIKVPNSVGQGAKLKVKVYDCVSGDTWEAKIVVEVLDSTGAVVFDNEYQPEEDGSDRVKIKIKAARYPAGEYTLRVRCIHEFDAGGEGTFFDEREPFEVRSA